MLIKEFMVFGFNIGIGLLTFCIAAKYEQFEFILEFTNTV